MTAVRFPSVPLADDPDLAEHALWCQEIADDLEQQAKQAEADATGRAMRAGAELRKLAERTVTVSADYRRAIADMHDAGMSYARIGEVPGISRGTVQGHVERYREDGDWLRPVETAKASEAFL